MEQQNTIELAPDTQLYRNEAAQKRPSLADVFGAQAVESPKNKQKKSLEGSSPAKTSQDLEANNDSVAATATRTLLTWWNGVMVPCLLNIWGVIMFLRLGWVVGQAGILLGTAIITLSNIVTGITAMSLFAICTNGEVKGGGAYFLISRSLGPLYGGVIGLLFFVAQAVASSMYVIGFSDSVNDIFKKSGGQPFTGTWANDQRVISVITMTILAALALAGGAKYYAKAQIFLLVSLVIAMIAMTIGAFFDSVPTESENVDFGFVGFDGKGINSNGTTLDLYAPGETSVWLPQFSTDPETLVSHGFFSVFAVFFPAVTGIMAGANMSGDLKNPSEDIPKGTIRAITLTYITYVALLCVIGFTSARCSDADMTKCPIIADATWAANVAANPSLLPEGGALYNKLIVTAHSLWAPLVYVGVFAATLSSALASIVGAPRILQSLAGDKIFPWPILEFFAKGSGPGNEPLRGYVLTYFVGTACCLVGALDVIAPIIANFFMISYGVTNYACYAAHESKSPSWRPTFKYYNPYLSLFGAFLCAFAMFLMDWANSLVSCGVSMMLFLYLHHIKPETNWGPAGEARKYTSALRGLESLETNAQDHVKTFRPQLLFMCGNPQDRPSLLGFAVALRAARGAMVMGNVIVPDIDIHEQAAAASVGSEDVEASMVAEKDPIEEQLKQRKQMIQYLAKSAEARKEMYKFIYNNEKAPELKKSGIMCEVVCAPNLLNGFVQILQLGGLGRLRPNTVCLGYKSDWQTCSNESAAMYESMVASSMANNSGVIIVRDPQNTLALNALNTVGSNNEVGADSDELQISAGKVNESNTDITGDGGGVTVASVRSMSTATGIGGKSLLGKKQKNKRRIDVYWLADVSGGSLNYRIYYVSSTVFLFLLFQCFAIYKKLIGDSLKFSFACTWVLLTLTFFA